MNLTHTKSASGPLNHEDRVVIVTACDSLVEGGADPDLVAAYLGVVAEFLRIGLLLKDIDAILGSPTSPNKALEAP